jgi:hypothetical protein
MKFWMLLILPLILSACGSQLRRPFCQDSLKEFPPSMIGTYTVTMPKADQGMNNATTFEQQTIQITKDGLMYPSALDPVALFQNGEPKSDRVCMIQGQIYMEKLNSNSTYTVSKIEPSEYGLAFSDLSFSVQDLKQEGIPFIVIPNLQLVEGVDSFWTLSMTLGSQPVIVDNTKVSPEKLIKISKRASLYFTFSRAKEPFKGAHKFLSLKALTSP